MKSRDLQKRGGKELSWWESGLGDQVVVCMHLRGGGGAGGGTKKLLLYQREKKRQVITLMTTFLTNPGDDQPSPKR